MNVLRIALIIVSLALICVLSGWFLGPIMFEYSPNYKNLEQKLLDQEIECNKKLTTELNQFKEEVNKQYEKDLK